MNTTIQIKKTTLDRLKLHKIAPRSSYDEVLNTVLDEVEDDMISTEEIIDIQEALEDVKKGRLHRIEDVAKELGIDLL